ncbi:N-formylglutamate amidohydrolase [Ramlibacter sp. PS4R-6]|uniref:N-formylglutamate amidohydrolase n=1 Tax=Ramlibacter sp. PS4R-6 TaxID=3133438 RepID=UPI0030955636
MDAWIRVVPGTSPLVLDSPHSGTVYPEDFRHACDMGELRQAEDTHVEKLYDFAPAMGIAWVEALFPRSYLDVNRNVTEIDVAMLEDAWRGEVASDPKSLAKVRLGKGLIWRITDSGVPIYSRKLTAAEVEARIENCWRPFHEAVGKAIDAAHRRHGWCIHIDCHSMPAVSAPFSTDYPGLVHADFVIGDREGTTADPRLSKKICAHLEALGYSASYNHPYKGVELVRRHADPAHHRHSIQVEINRKLYMDEATLELTPRAARLKADLRSLLAMLLETDPRRL